MGSKPSRVGGTVLAASAGKVVHPPAQECTTSAPPTPLHPEGTPRVPDDEAFPPPHAPPGNSAHVVPEAPQGRPAFHPASSAPETLLAATAPSQVAFPQEGAIAPAVANSAAGVSCAADSRQSAQVSPQREGDVAAPAAPTSELVNFDLPLEDVLGRATDAFGTTATSLSSTKWDRRVQALKGVSTVLKGLEIKAGLCGIGTQAGERSAGRSQVRDPARYFNAACLILHITMRDKVLPVLLAAHELFQVTFEYAAADVSEEAARLAIGVLFQHPLSKIGDLNIRLHDSACAAVVFSATRTYFGVAEVLLRLRQHLEEQRRSPVARGPQWPRVHAGILDTVGHVLRKFPGRREGEGDRSDAVATWTLADVSQFIVEGASAGGVAASRVHQAAVGLAVTVHETFGKGQLELLLRQLPPGAQESMRSMMPFDEDDDGGYGDDGDVVELTGAETLCVVGVGFQPQSPVAAGYGGAGGAGGVAAPLGMAASLAKDIEEECFMDEILEETGMVFKGEGLKAVAAPSGYRSALDEDLQRLGLSID